MDKNLENKMASAIGFPLETIVKWNSDGRVKTGDVIGLILDVIRDGAKEPSPVFFGQIYDRCKEAALKKNVPFPIESTVEWEGPFEGPFGPSPGRVGTKGIVKGYLLIVLMGDGNEVIVEPEELTVLNVTGVVNRGQQVQPGQNRNAGRTPNLGELTPTRDQLVRAKAQLAHLGREPTEAELAAELKKVQKFSALMKGKIKSTKQGGRKSRKNRRTRRTK